MRPDTYSLPQNQYNQSPNDGTPTNTNKSSSPIRDAVYNMEEVAAQLSEAIGRLESRLEDVLTPVPPVGDPTTGAAALPKPTSALLERSVSFHGYLARLCARVNQITDRVEV